MSIDEILKAVEQQLRSQSMQGAGDNNVQAGQVGGNLQHITIQSLVINVGTVAANQAPAITARPPANAPAAMAPRTEAPEPPRTFAPRPQLPHSPHANVQLLGRAVQPADKDAPVFPSPPSTTQSDIWKSIFNGQRSKLRQQESEQLPDPELRRQVAEIFALDRRRPGGKERSQLLDLMASSAESRSIAMRFMSKNFNCKDVIELDASAARRTLKYVEKCAENSAIQDAEKSKPMARKWAKTSN